MYNIENRSMDFLIVVHLIENGIDEKQIVDSDIG